MQIHTIQIISQDAVKNQQHKHHAHFWLQ